MRLAKEMCKEGCGVPFRDLSFSWKSLGASWGGSGDVLELLGAVMMPFVRIFGGLGGGLFGLVSVIVSLSFCLFLFLWLFLLQW